MLNIYICEDNLEQLSRMTKAVEEIVMMESYDMTIALNTHDPNELLKTLENNGGTGVYFLDVDLQAELTGIALASLIRKLDPRGFIIFVTTHAEMTYLTFQYKVEALDYIIKDDFTQNRQRIQACLKNVNEKYSHSNLSTQKSFHVKSGERIIHIDYSDILFFETAAKAHRVTLYCDNRVEEFHGSIKEVESQIDERFVRCHQSYLVNRDRIKELDKKQKRIILDNNQTCEVSVRGMRVMKNLI